MLADFLILLALLLLNGLLAMAEMAVVSARPTRLRELAKAGHAGARAALRLQDDSTRFLSTVQIGITLIGVLAGVYSGARFAMPLGDWLAGLGLPEPLAGHETAIAYGLVVVAVTYLSLVIGELVPKRWALVNPEAVAAVLARPLELLAFVSAPLVWILQRSTDLLLRFPVLRRARRSDISEDEIRAMIAEGTRTGVFQRAEQQMIDGVLRLADRTVRSIMVPRGEVVWLDTGDSRETVLNAVRACGHSRYPVCRGELDELLGIVGTSVLVDWLRDPAGGELAARLQAPLIVHESTRILRLLDLFRESRTNIAIVVDEHGSIEGLTTPADILTAIAGDLPDTASEDSPEAVPRDDQSWLIDGRMAIDEVERLLGCSGMRSGDDYTTLAGFVLAQLGHLPVTAENFRWSGLRFEVVDMDGRRIDKLLVQRLGND
ncbi:MAG: HlyC/CorC family transporter [Gammaproteobacteria bacterium]|nr:HlyC/CorC family transporter [Gammaproteobacteria bacterium]